ncbi:MAG: universal stress protein [Haloarculaceae archaeon]
MDRENTYPTPRNTARSRNTRAEAHTIGLTVVTEIVEGDPHGEILEYVSEHDIDLVVMGTHGRTGTDRIVMRSVAERVVRRSPVPVLTVRGGAYD